jgi:hypothetical protein
VLDFGDRVLSILRVNGRIQWIITIQRWRSTGIRSLGIRTNTAQSANATREQRTFVSNSENESRHPPEQTSENSPPIKVRRCYGNYHHPELMFLPQ